MEQKLKHIATLTAGNNHGGARWYVADLFSYLALYKRRFELIDKLHELDGSMNYDLSNYRQHITHEMLDIIERKENKETLQAIQNVL